MGKRGMAPEPTHLKIIKGNPGRRPLNENEPKPAPVFTLPSPPSWMDTYAKAEWKRMGAILVRIGVLTAADLTAFSAYCSAYARWRRCEEKLIGVHKENGGYTDRYGRTRHPECVTVERAFEQLLRMAQQFGATPSARTQITVDRPIDDRDFFGD